MEDLARWLGEQLDEDALWATEASRRYGEQAPDGGVHWCWEATGNDEELQPDPSSEEWIGQRAESAVSLRSRETWPTRSVGDLPQFAIQSVDEVPSAVAGHIIRHDPARVLRDIEAKRRTLVRCQEEMLSGIPRLVHFAKQTVREMAAVYEDRPGYAESVAAYE